MGAAISEAERDENTCREDMKPTANAGEGCTLPASAIGQLRAALCALVLQASKEHDPAGD